ncbi:MAG: carboxylate--amine ligase [Cellulomonadaceae bacterium]|jgi:D-aspartate ligase|nr:carboxylate--amine ligase [Cellulomonadaceae bacterium]
MANSSSESAAANIVVVGIGGDVGMYALCRSFHEAFGAPAVVLSTVATRAMQRSSFVENVVVPGLSDDETLITELERQAARFPSATRVLLTNSDWHIHTVVEHRERLEGAGYFLRYPSKDVLDRVCTKEGFAEICDRLGIPTPRTLALEIHTLTGPDSAARISSAVADAEDLTYPVIAKPSDSSQWFEVSFPGKRKIHTLSTATELSELLGHLVEAAYPGALLVQEYIPGDETMQRSMTAYRSTAGEVTLLSTGRVLLEEHTPGTLGIPAAIVVEPYEDAMESAEKFLHESQYVGFGNFDFKYDSRTGEHVFFEMNPRIGRNNYYVTAAGVNVAEVLLADTAEARQGGEGGRAGAVGDEKAWQGGEGGRAGVVADGGGLAQQRALNEVLYTVIPFSLLTRYITDPELLARLKSLKKRKAVVNPLYYSGDASPVRRFITWMITYRYRSKYAKFYPQPLDG